jgi:hypothetical protein
MARSVSFTWPPAFHLNERDAQARLVVGSRETSEVPSLRVDLAEIAPSAML